MAVIQIIYLAINLIGIGIGIAYISCSDDFPFIADFFSSISKRLGNIGLAITSTIFIALFGGWIWESLGIETLFICSAILGLINSAYAATIKAPKQAN